MDPRGWRRVSKTEDSQLRKQSQESPRGDPWEWWEKTGVTPGEDMAPSPEGARLGILSYLEMTKCGEIKGSLRDKDLELEVML